jgi:hypothetical protein
MLDPRILFFGQILLAPALIGGAIALARSTPRRTILALAVSAAVVTLGGVVFYDAITGLRGQAYYYATYATHIGKDLSQFVIASLVLGAGVALSNAAGTVALARTAHLGRWGWFAAVLAVMALTGAVTYSFYVGFPDFLLGTDLQARIAAGDSALSTPYYLVVSVLLVSLPTASLLYGLREPDARKGLPPAEAPSASPAPLQ